MVIKWRLLGAYCSGLKHLCVLYDSVAYFFVEKKIDKYVVHLYKPKYNGQFVLSLKTNRQGKVKRRQHCFGRGWECG